MLDAVLVADPVEDMLEGVPITGAVGELDAVIREHDVDRIRHGHDEVSQELGRSHFAGLRVQFLAHPWPGNVRELRNVVERSALLTRSGGEIGAVDLSFEHASTPSVDWLDGSLPDAVARLETEMIRRALERTRGNRAEAARVLGIQRQLLYAKIDRYGLGTV